MRKHFCFSMAIALLISLYLPLFGALPSDAQTFTSPGTRFGMNCEQPGYTDMAYTDVFMESWWGGFTNFTAPFSANNYPTQGYPNGWDSAETWFCLTGDLPGSNQIYSFYGEGCFVLQSLQGNFFNWPASGIVPNSYSALPPNYPGNPTNIAFTVQPGAAANPNANPPTPANPYGIPLVIPANSPANNLNVVVTTCQLQFNIPQQPTGGYTYAQGLPLTWIHFSNVNPNNLPNEGLNNFHLIRPGYPAWKSSDSFFPVTSTSFPIFTKEFLNSFAPFCCIRFMDWMNTNNNVGLTWTPNGEINNGTYSWAQRPPFNGGQYFGCGGLNNGNSGGPAYELMIALCNATGCDAWINVPLQATDDWKTGFANLFANDPVYHLNPWLHVHYEHGNELWNWGFLAWSWVDGLAQTNFGSDGKGAWFEHGEETGELIMSDVDVMQPIFGAMGRPILAGFFGDPSDYCGGGLYYIQKTYGPPKNFIYGIAVAPYFGDDPTEFTGTGWNVQGVISAMNVANQYGVKLCGYEGGAGLTQTPESAYDTSVAEEQTPQMAACYVDFANMWQSQGGDLCNFFTNTGVDSQYGLYGHLPIISLVDDLSNPFCTKYNAAASLNSSLGCNCGNAEPPPPPPQPAPPPPTPPPAPAPSPAPSSANKSSGSTGSSTSSSSANTSMKGIKYLGNNRWWSPIYGYFSTSPINGPRH